MIGGKINLQPFIPTPANIYQLRTENLTSLLNIELRLKFLSLLLFSCYLRKLKKNNLYQKLF